MQLEVITRTPSVPTTSPPLLFVHGAWHGAWCWDAHFLPYFAEQGFSVTALSLRGHGKSEGSPRVRGKRIAQYVTDVAQVAATLSAPPVIIAHSMGGHVLQKYLETHDAAGAVLMASVPPHGTLPVSLRILRRHPGPFLLANLTTRLYPIIATPALAQDAFFSATMPAEEMQGYFQQIQDESYLAYLDMIALNLPHPKRVLARAKGKLPMLVLGGAKDRIFTPKEVEGTARAYGTTATIFPNMAHDLMLDPDWQHVADAIIAWLRGLPS
jgi:pimeloyl-ACP methyl ester carboxylesterase